MIRKTKYIVTCIFIVLLGNVYANKTVDSLIGEVQGMPEDTGLVYLYNHISWSLLYSNPDSALIFAKKGLALSQKIDYTFGKEISYDNMGIAYDNLGNYENSLRYHNKSLLSKIESNNLQGVSVGYTNIGVVFQRIGQFEESLNFYLKAKRIKEKLDDDEGIANCNTNIGIVYFLMDEFKKAISYFKEAGEFFKAQNNLGGLAAVKNNIGEIYEAQGNYKESIKENEEATVLFQELNDVFGISDCYATIGRSYSRMKEYRKANTYILKAIGLKETLKDQRGLSIAYNYITENLISYYRVIGKSSLLSEALVYNSKSYEIAKELGILVQQQECLEQRCLIYEIRGENNLAYPFLKELMEIKDSILNKEKIASLGEIEAKYENEKHKLLISNLEKEKALQNAVISKKESVNKRQKLWMLIFIVAMSIILAFAIIAYKLYIGKKRFSELLILRNQEITQQKAEIEAQRDVLTNHKGEIEYQNKHITQSIKYAKRIQDAMLANVSSLDDVFKEYFILFKPKEIVSGDFYYVDKKYNKVYVAVVDCTGHGVPGAFMSIIGANILKKSLHELDLNRTNEILNQLSKEIREVFSNPYKSSIKDGMDLTIMSYNLETKEVEVSGVRNPMYIVKGDEVIKVKPDPLPIGEEFTDEFKSYTTKTFELKSGDKIYLFTDGYYDQLGGKHNRKFMLKRFREMLAESNGMPMKNQRMLLEDKLDEWQGYREQYDDILVMGVRIP